MNSKTTVALVGLALVLFGYIYFVDLGMTRSSQRRQESAELLLPNLDPAKVTGIEIVRTNQTIHAELTDGEWRLSTPAYPAHSAPIESFLKALTLLKRQTEISAQEIISQSGGLSPFGLDPPSATIRITQGTNLIQLRVGTLTLLGDRVYVQPVGVAGTKQFSSAIYATDLGLLQNLPASPNLWRSPMLLLSAMPFDRISISAGSRQPLKLERDVRDKTNLLWRLVEPMAARADYNRVEFGLLHQIRRARVHEFVSDDPKADLEPFGLQTPEADLTLAFGTNPVFQVQFGKSPTNDPTLVYARCLNHTNVVLVSKELLDLVQQRIGFYRDHRLFTFTPGLLARIEVQADESFVVDRQADGAWRINQPFQAAADRQLMQMFIEALASLEVIDFGKDVETDFSSYGLTNAQRRYTLMTSLTNAAGPTNQTLVQVEFGHGVKNEFGKVFCRRRDEPSVYIVGLADVINLPRAAFQLRDLRVWSFASSNVTAVRVRQAGQAQELRRDPTTRAWRKDDPVANAAIEETLYRLGALQADAWTDKGEEKAKHYGTADGKYQIQLDVNEAGKAHLLALSFGRLALSGQPYAAVTLEQGQPVVFKFPAQLYKWVAQYLSIGPPPSSP